MSKSIVNKETKFDQKDRECKSLQADTYGTGKKRKQQIGSKTCFFFPAKQVRTESFVTKWWANHKEKPKEKLKRYNKELQFVLDLLPYRPIRLQSFKTTLQKLWYSVQSEGYPMLSQIPKIRLERVYCRKWQTKSFSHIYPLYSHPEKETCMPEECTNYPLFIPLDKHGWVGVEKKPAH